MLALLTPLLILLLYTTALDWGVVHTLGQPNNVKTILAESGIYDSIIPSLLDQAKQQTSAQGDISLSNPAVKAAAAQALPSSYIQNQTNTIIDSVYAWLNGATPQPDFQINLASAKATFADSLATQVQQRAATLQVCAASVDISTYDALSATCLPRGITPQAAADSVKQNILSGKGFLDNPVISADQLKNGNSQKSVFADQLKTLPAQYQKAKKTPLLLIVSTIVVAALIYFLSSSKRAGLKHLGVTVLIVGLLMLVFSWSLNKSVSSFAVPKIKLDNAVLQANVRNLVIDLTQRVDKNYWMFGAIYTTLGAIALCAPYIINKKGSASPQTESKPDVKPAKPESAQTAPKPSAPAPPRPKKRVVKVQ